jgi:hypothetical protein
VVKWCYLYPLCFCLIVDIVNQQTNFLSVKRTIEFVGCPVKPYASIGHPIQGNM